MSPYFIYARREVDVEDLSYRVKKKKLPISTGEDHGRTNTGSITVFTTYVYDGTKKIFVFSGECDFFHEQSWEGPEPMTEVQEVVAF